MTVATFSSVNQAVTTTANLWNVLRVALLAAGWTQEGSGDGTTFSNAAAGPVVDGSTGVGGLDGTGRWVRLADPDGNREMIIFRGSSATQWSLVYSYSAGFTGGTPSASARPTATDEVTIINAATFGSTAVGYAHAIVEDVAINGVWGWWLVRTVQSTSVRVDFVACDPLSSEDDSQRFDVLGADVDPLVWLSFPNSASPSLSNTSLTTNAMQHLLYPGDPAALLINVIVPRVADYTGGGNTLADGTAAPNGVPVSPWDSGDDIFSVIYGRFNSQTSATPSIIVGASHHLSLKCVTARQYPDSVEHASLDLAWVYYSTIAIPWPKGTTPSA